MWVENRLVFVSDRAAKLPGTAEEASRQANLWAFDEGIPTESSEARQLTNQTPEQGYVRDASTDGRRIVWHSR
jgi:tricorn protease